MHVWTIAFLITTSGACRSYFTEDHQEIPLGCVRGLSGLTPWEPTRIDTQFLVYDRSHLESPLRVIPWNTSFDSKDDLLNFGNNLHFVIHGFSTNPQRKWVQDLKTAFLEKGPRTKVVLVDWSIGAFYNVSSNGTDLRQQAANNALMVGRVVACFIQRIISTYGLPETSVHIYGHSMGAQIMGRAAAWLSEEFGIRIGSGVASEASAQPFDTRGIRPARGDMHFLLAIHTASLITKFEGENEGARGIFEAFGDVDLYPNRGVRIQPACKGNDNFLCSHNVANVYFIEMVALCNGQCDFEGFICGNEQDALDGMCSNRTVNVCSFIRNLEGRGAGLPRKSNVLTFETDTDQLNVICTTMVLGEAFSPFSKSII